MARLSRKLRVCKWVGTIGCVLIAAAFAVSGWWMLSFVWSTRQDGRVLSLNEGCVTFHRTPYNSPVTPGWDLTPNSYPSFDPPFRVTWEATIVTDSLGCAVVSIPLWFPLLVLLIPTLLLWRHDRRKPRPGCCRRCEYDLTGNVSGKCPECGSEIAVPGGLNVTERRR